MAEMRVERGQLDTYKQVRLDTLKNQGHSCMPRQACTHRSILMSRKQDRQVQPWRRSKAGVMQQSRQSTLGRIKGLSVCSGRLARTGAD